METNLTILTETLGWSEGSLTGCEEKPISIPIKAVLQAMEAVREEIREEIRQEIAILEANKKKYRVGSVSRASNILAIMRFKNFLREI